MTEKSLEEYEVGRIRRWKRPFEEEGVRTRRPWKKGTFEKDFGRIR